MSLKYGILGLLSYGPMTGYELNRAFHASLAFFWKATMSQVYRELKQMEQKGWVSATTIIQHNGKPNKKEYTLTQEGREAFVRWLAGPVVDSDLEVRSAFLMKIFFSAQNSPMINRENLHRFKEISRKQLSALQQETGIQEYGQKIQDKRSVTYWELTRQFGERYYQLCVEWAEMALATVEDQGQ